MDYKKVIDEYYRTHQTRLREVFRNILQANIPIHCNKNTIDDLIAESYIYVNENIDKIIPNIEAGKLEGVIVNFGHKQIIWNNTKFKKVFIEHRIFEKTDKAIFLEDPIHLECDQQEKNDEYDLYLEIEYHYQELNSTIRERYMNLSPSNKILYELYFNGPYNSSSKLAKYLNLSRTTCNNMVRALKDDLTQGLSLKPKTNN